MYLDQIWSWDSAVSFWQRQKIVKWMPICLRITRSLWASDRGQSVGQVLITLSVFLSHHCIVIHNELLLPGCVRHVTPHPSWELLTQSDFLSHPSICIRYFTADKRRLFAADPENSLQHKKSHFRDKHNVFWSVLWKVLEICDVLCFGSVGWF